MPVMPAGSGMVFVPQAPRMPPPMPSLGVAGPYEQERTLGVDAMVQTFNSAISVTNASIRLLARNPSRKVLCITNPSALLTIFLDFATGPATVNSFPLAPGGSIQIWSGGGQCVPKEEVYGLCSAAGPVLVNVLEFS